MPLNINDLEILARAAGASKKPLIFQRDTAFQLALRLTMRRILATLAVVGALLFSAGSAWADDKSEANKLFVDAVGLITSAKEADQNRSSDAESSKARLERFDALAKALRKMHEIIDDYPGTDVAVKLVSQTPIGIYTLDNVTELVTEARTKLIESVEQGDPQVQAEVGHAYYEGDKGFTEDHARACELFSASAHAGNTMGQYFLGLCFQRGDGGFPKDNDKAMMWWGEAAKQLAKKGDATYISDFYAKRSECKMVGAMHLSHDTYLIVHDHWTPVWNADGSNSGCYKMKGFFDD